MTIPFASRDGSETSGLTDRDVLATFFLAMFVLRGFFDRGGAAGPGLAQSVVNAPEAIGLAALAVSIARLGRSRVLDSRTWIALGLAGLVGIHPGSQSTAIALTLVGTVFALRSQSPLRPVGLLCLGFAWIGLWGALLFNVIAPWLLPIETAIAFLPLSLRHGFALAGNMIQGEHGFSVVMNPACSAFSNTLRAAFLWYSLTVVFGFRFDSRSQAYLCASIALIVALNTARVSVMATSYAAYDYWHNGTGASIFGVALLVASLLPFAVMVLRRPVRSVA